MQNIKNFWHADPEISVLWTNERTAEQTDEAEFIGPFQLKPWVRKLITFDDNDPAWMNVFIENKIKWKYQI